MMDQAPIEPEPGAFHSQNVEAEEGTEAGVQDRFDPAWPLVSFDHLLQESVAPLLQAHQHFVQSIAAFSKTVRLWKLVEAESRLGLLSQDLVYWQTEWAAWQQVLHRASTRLVDEVHARPDLELEAASALALHADFGDTEPSQAQHSLAGLLRQILHYDCDREAVSADLARVWAAIRVVEQEIAVWLQKDLETAIVAHKTTDPGMTLTDLRALLAEAEQELRDLESHRVQLGERTLNRIAALDARLLELDLLPDTMVADGYRVGSLARIDLAHVSPAQLVAVEQSLDRLLVERITMAHAAAPVKLAQELRHEWSDEKFVELLEGLARQGRGAKVLLLLLAAGAARQEQQALDLPAPVVASVLSGVRLFAEEDPFGFLNALAPGLVAGWQAAAADSQAELCLVFMAAQYATGRQLPDGFLWQFPLEWPLEGMPGWDVVWQAALQAEPLPIIAGVSPEDWDDRLAQARSHARQALTREHGFFVRLNSLKSRRHQAMMNSEIIPYLLSRLAILEAIEQELPAADRGKENHLLLDLQKILTGTPARAIRAGEQVEPFEESLAEHQLLDLYEAAVLAAGIDDSEVFHKRTALRLVEECAASILEYGHALLQFWRNKLHVRVAVTSDALQAELSPVQLSPLGQSALQVILQQASHELAPGNEAVGREAALRHLLHELLGREAHALRLPRLVGSLTEGRLDLAEWIEPLLDDLGMPVDAGEAARLLLDHEAHNQVLLLTQYLALDVQKQAQALRWECEKEIEDKEIEILKLGGTTQDLGEDRELGRWRLVRRELDDRLEKLQYRHRVEQRRVDERARGLRSRINALDERAFGARSTMPVDGYDMVEKGLALARKASKSEPAFGAAEAYLEEIEYRLEHCSWPLADLQNANAQLERALAGQLPPGDVPLSVDRVLQMLESGDLQYLGLSPNEVTLSQVATRCDFLNNWLIIRNAEGFNSEDLKATERMAIQNLFRHFAALVSMKRSNNPDGKPIAFEHPVVYSYWELQYPKTAALEKQCILIALPGNPPAAKDLSDLQSLIDDKAWLDYFFVFAFAPGCTPKVHQRLRSSYQDRGLVLIDESAMLDMVLAESRSNNPLGRLRPIMLNACAAADIDVFKINQLVNARNAIFVGRDSLVERIASGGDNYALYGGRRIGKSSVLMALENRMRRRGVTVVSHSFEGCDDCSDNGSTRYLARLLNLQDEVQNAGDFKLAIQALFEAEPSLNLVFLLDEIDRYILANPQRHVLIEALRALSDHYGSQFRVVVAGFMGLHDCLRGRGPYSPSSDPWVRMLNDIGPVGNLKPASAEQIVQEGFVRILGWDFETRAIPQRIVERTGGHPAFVQCFCSKLQERAGRRGDRRVGLDDVEAVFADQDPEHSFTSYVRKTLEMNLDPLARYLILWLAAESGDVQGFTLGQMQELASMSRLPIPDNQLSRSIERLVVTGVVKSRAPEVYEFSVPDYPLILNRLGETVHLEYLEDQLEQYLKDGQNGISK